ncbi:MAG: FAD-binding protein, partial [Planctomycetes bacterium]|nr:FAD-binding protein [Planctomycetota bacterium]
MKSSTGPPNGADSSEELADALRLRVGGEVRFDRLSRAIYATDASIYEIVPRGVVFPRDVSDVTAVVETCRQFGTSIIARGAGTGLTGGAVGFGVQLDLSRFMSRVTAVDPKQKTVDVQAGVVLDDLNRSVAMHGLHFAPDVATSSRATIGGMIANNSCGAHSIVYGRTVDHVLGLVVVLADGAVVSLGDAPPIDPCASTVRTEDTARLETVLGQIRDEYYEEIQSRFPRILRSNGGYGLDRLGTPGERVEVIKLLCGSEGTLAVVVGAKLKLTPLPRAKGLAVLHFADLLTAVAVTPGIIQFQPSAIELIDRMIIDAGRSGAALRDRLGFLQGDPDALLVVEFFGDDKDEVSSKLERFVQNAEVRRRTDAIVTVLDPHEQDSVWELRTRGLGLLMSKPGDKQPYGFVEDTAVDPSRLEEYISRFKTILDREDVDAGFYAHASVGCLHVRPVLNLKRADDVTRMHRIAEAVSSLAVEFGGTMTAEHGDGIVRSCWLEKQYGPRIIEAFRRVKGLFDPDGVLNPNKIVDPMPMTEHLRFGSEFRAVDVKTHLDFSAEGGMAGLAGMCSGVGQCRQRMVGTMCPSFVATGDELHTTRARANALRVALSNRDLLDGLDDPQLDEVMDLCLSCKACKTECPTGVDMARLKAEFLANRNRRFGVDRGDRLVVEMPNLARWASRVPRLSNLVTRSETFRRMGERYFGFDRRISLPRFAIRTFRAWFRRHGKTRESQEAPRGEVVYFVDTWTNYFQPEVGVAAVRLLERAGFKVVCPDIVCCGRPAISKGLLAEAKIAAERNVCILASWSRDGVPIVGTEPSCILTLVDEYPQLVRNRAAKRIASQALMLETFLYRLLQEDAHALGTLRRVPRLLYHAHCHQKAIVGPSDALALVQRIG